MMHSDFVPSPDRHSPYHEQASDSVDRSGQLNGYHRLSEAADASEEKQNQIQPNNSSAVSGLGEDNEDDHQNFEPVAFEASKESNLSDVDVAHQDDNWHQNVPEFSADFFSIARHREPLHSVAPTLMRVYDSLTGSSTT